MAFGVRGDGRGRPGRCAHRQNAAAQPHRFTGVQGNRGILDGLISYPGSVRGTEVPDGQAVFRG
ncbi:hypothetical protein GCM10022223_03030 [Kineosporia mesophila]|uniref:Uncharacterized protein n=1 Tax=Kineosporia mesophila TaxID=566012 RepID=A0ABP6YVM3_9ACTN